MAKPLVSDDLWQRIAPLLPRDDRSRHRRYAGRKPIDDRRVLEGIVFVLRTGLPWAALPASAAWPSGVTCWRRLRAWHRAGVWQRLWTVVLTELRAHGALDLRRALVDSASVRAPGGGPATGPSPVDRRKPGTKHHLATDARGTPLAVTVTGANRTDITQLLDLIARIPPLGGRPGPPRRRPDRVQGDRAYDSEPHRIALKKKASGRSSRAAAHRTAAASDGPAGPSSAASPGYTSSESSASATRRPRRRTKPSSSSRVH